MSEIFFILRYTQWQEGDNNQQSLDKWSVDPEDVETIKSKSTTAQENTLGKIANTMQQQQKKSQPILTTLTEITKEFKKEIDLNNIKTDLLQD